MLSSNQIKRLELASGVQEELRSNNKLINITLRDEDQDCIMS